MGARQISLRWHTGADPTKVPGFTYPEFREQKMVPGIIEDRELSGDGKNAVYHLRKGVKSAFGNEFTADDVLWRVERAHAMKAIGSFLQNAANVDDPKQWQKVDDHTVRIVSDKPMPLICKILTNLYWYWYDSTEAKKHATADDPWASNWAANAVAAFGPYQIKSWEAGRRVVMEANPNYWQGVPAIKRIIYQVVPNRRTAWRCSSKARSIWSRACRRTKRLDSRQHQACASRRCAEISPSTSS